MKPMNIKEKHNIDGYQFSEISIPFGKAIIWEDDNVVCMPIMRIDEDKRGQGNGTKLFKMIEQYAKNQKKLFQISDAPESIIPMRKIMKNHGYSKNESMVDNWGNEDTIAMYRKDNDTIYSDEDLLKRHLLIYRYFNKEPEVKMGRCTICLTDFDREHYVCPNCGLCLRCQCISFSKNACHLCANGTRENREGQKCVTRTFYQKF